MLEPTADIVLGDFNMLSNPTLDKYPTNVSIPKKDMHINERLEIINVTDVVSQDMYTKFSTFSRH